MWERENKVDKRCGKFLSSWFLKDSWLVLLAKQKKSSGDRWGWKCEEERGYLQAVGGTLHEAPDRIWEKERKKENIWKTKQEKGAFCKNTKTKIWTQRRPVAKTRDLMDYEVLWRNVIWITGLVCPKEWSTKDSMLPEGQMSIFFWTGQTLVTWFKSKLHSRTPDLLIRIGLIQS